MLCYSTSDKWMKTMNRNEILNVIAGRFLYTNEFHVRSLRYWREVLVYMTVQLHFLGFIKWHASAENMMHEDRPLWTLSSGHLTYLRIQLCERSFRA